MKIILIIFFVLLQIIFFTHNGITEDWKKKLEEGGYIKTEEERKREFEEKQYEWEQQRIENEKKEEEMREERENLENTAEIIELGDNLYKKVYYNGEEHLCIRNLYKEDECY